MPQVDTGLGISEDTYDLIEHRFGQETAEYVKDLMSEDRGVLGYNADPKDTGFDVSGESYQEVVGSRGLDAAIMDYHSDLQQHQKEVIGLLVQEAASEILDGNEI